MKKSDPVFELSRVRVRYGLRSAIESLSLSTTPGSALALLGTNGSGKTSTLRVLLGLIRPSQGRATIFGQTPGTPGVLQRIGFAPESALPPEFLTGEEYLRFSAAFKIKSPKDRKEAVSEILEWTELPGKAKFGDYSKGMRRRLVLAQAFLGKPDLLILDEPLNGIDPLFIIKLRKRLESYLTEGGTLLLSSHILAEVERVCTHVAILRKGKLVCSSSLSDLLKEYGSIESAFQKKVMGKK
jgi:ABC-2 type transport system ATP-binding protein